MNTAVEDATVVEVAVVNTALPGLDGEPTPYDRYTRWPQLSALWPRTGLAADWPGGILVACGFQAVELCLRLVTDARDDDRDVADSHRRVHRLSEHLVAGLRAVLQTLATLPAPPPELLSAAAGPARAVSPGLTQLSQLTTAQVDELTTVFAVHAQRLPYRFGIEHHLAAARAAHGLPRLIALDDTAFDHTALADIAAAGSAAADIAAGYAGSGARPVLDFDRVVQPWRAWSLREMTPYGPEDHLFATAHQISESWLAITATLLGRGGDAAATQRWSRGAVQLLDGHRFLALVIEAGRLLDQMVMADYHPLRVALRDGSGAQSRTVHRLAPLISEANRHLLEHLAARDLVLVDVLDRPGEHPGLHAFTGAVEAAGKQVQNFLFQHYLLVLSIMGNRTLGSLGAGVHTLVAHAAASLTPAIDEAHHDLAMLTQFRHGAHSGEIVYRQELADGDPYPPLPVTLGCPPEVMRRQVGRYYELLTRRDVEGWVGLFHPEHGRMQDVPGTRPFAGPSRLRRFLNAFLDAFPQVESTVDTLVIDGNRAWTTYQLHGVSYRGAPTAMHGTEEFVFDAEGRLLEVTANWDPATVAEQWQPTHRRPAPATGSTHRRTATADPLARPCTAATTAAARPGHPRTGAAPHPPFPHVSSTPA